MTEAMRDPSGLSGLAPVPVRSMWRYRDRLPIASGIEPVTLGEGMTPLLPSRLMPGLALFWKDETRNPTGSHKDRALSLAATDARAKGARVMAVVSAGSTGISNAAYAARAGLPSVAFFGRGASEERLYPVHALGSRLVEVECGIDALIAALARLGGREGVYVASTTRASNPVQAEAARTIAYEIVDDLGHAPDWAIVPTGGGGTIAALAAGFDDLRASGRIARVPRLAAVVPAELDALRTAFERGIADQAAFEALPYSDETPTILSKLAHAHPPDGVEALAALRRTRGIVVPVGDDAALDAVRTVATTDGLYLEPSSAVVLPALQALTAEGAIRPGECVVALACGHGLRESVLVGARRPSAVRRARLEDLPQVLLG